MSAVVVFKEPKFKALPSGLPAVSDRELPVKLLAAERAIAACADDLPSLLNWKDQMRALATALATAKRPVLAKEANRVAKIAITTAATLVNEWEGARQKHVLDPRTKRIKIGGGPSERTQRAREFGLSINAQTNLVRIASAPKAALDRVMDNSRIPADMARMAKALPVTGKRGRSERRHSDECVRIMGGIDSLGTRHTGGLNQAAWALRSIDVAEVLIEMTGAQCVRALQVIGECEDMLDAIKALIERRQVAAS